MIRTGGHRPPPDGVTSAAFSSSRGFESAEARRPARDANDAKADQHDEEGEELAAGGDGIDVAVADGGESLEVNFEVMSRRCYKYFHPSDCSKHQHPIIFMPQRLFEQLSTSCLSSGSKGCRGGQKRRLEEAAHFMTACCAKHPTVRRRLELSATAAVISPRIHSASAEVGSRL
jgi:hypothetical protein